MRRSSSGGRNSLLPLRVKNDNSVQKPSSTRKSYSGFKSSFGTGRPSLSNSASSQRSRKSVASSLTSSGSNMRRSSGVKRYGHTELMKDPRPNSDRSYKDKCLRELVDFLTENNYPYPMSLRALQTPQTKDFIRIFEFLYSFFEPNFTVGKKIDEIVPQKLRQLGYPFMISKSTMHAVGSPHTWPTLLAALTWLRQQIQYSFGTNAEDILFGKGDTDFETVPEKQMVFDFCYHSYMEYLKGSDDFTQLDEDLAKALRSSGVCKDVDNLSQTNKRLHQEMAALEAEPDEMYSLQENLSTLSNDLDQLTKFCSQMELHNKKLEQEVNSVTEECTAQEAEVQTLTSDIKRKQQIFETQEFTPADVEKINMNRQELQRQISSIESENEELDRQIWASEMAYTKARSEVETKCSKYRHEAQLLQLIPSTADNARGMDFDLKTSVLLNDITHFANSVKPALLVLKTDSAAYLHQIREEKLNAKEGVEQVMEAVTEKQDSIKQLESQIKRLDENLETKRETAAKETSQLQSEIERLKEELMDLHKPSSLTLAEAHKSLAVDKANFEKAQKSCKREEKQYRSQLIQAIEMVVTEKQKIQEHVTAVKEKTKKYVEKEVVRIQTQEAGRQEQS